jgi:O-antigen/teichoic acid export membrane protein
VFKFKFLLRESFPFYLLALLTAVANVLPILFLAARSGHAEVGFYNAGYKMIVPLQMLFLTFMTTLYPGLSQTAITNTERFMTIIRNAFLGLTLLLSIMATFLTLLRREIIFFLFGPVYNPAANTMAFQSWYAVFMAIFGLIGVSLAARDRQKCLAKLSSCYALLATPILWWGSRYGAAGLAMSMLFVAFLNMTYHWVVFHKSLPFQMPVCFVLTLFAIVGISMLVAWSVPQVWPWSLRTILYLIFVGALLIFFLSLQSTIKGSMLSEKPTL